MRFLVVVLIIGVAFVPLVQLRDVISGATAGKIMLFRALIEGALFLCALQIFLGKKKPSAKEIWKAMKHPVALALFLFLLSMAASAFFSVNSGRAFWGTIERGEGVFGVLHYIALFFFVGWYLAGKERMILLKIFLVSGYALLLYGLGEIPWGTSRITSYIGNAAFFAGHLLFLIAVAWIVMQESTPPHQFSIGQRKTRDEVIENWCGGKKRGMWWYIALCFIPLATVGIIMTGTRSAILGLGLGSIILFFAWAVQKFGKKVLWAIVGVCIVGSIGIWLGSGRVRTLAEERSNSIQTRLMFWEAGWRAFQEKPLIGWGPEHFILASSAHYNPKAARYGETWFDRAHNKILDILVSQGVISLLIFMGLLGSVLYTVWRDTTYKKPLTFAFGSAYLVQTMFTPDQVVSWIGLMIFLGYIVGPRLAVVPPKRDEGGPRLVERIGGAGVGILMVAALYYGNALPYMQLKTLFEAKRAEDPILLLEQAFANNTFVHTEAAASVIDFYMENRPDLIIHSRIGEMIRDESRTLAEKEPQDIRYGIQYVRVMMRQGENTPALYGEAEKELRNLLRVAPKRQELYYLLAQTQGLEDKAEEAIETAEQAVKLAPEVARAHYVLGVALTLSGDSKLQRKAEEEFTEAEKLNPALNTLQNSDVDMLISIYESKKRWDRIADMALRNAEGVISWTTFHERVFTIALFHFAEEKNRESFVKIGTYMKSKFPEKQEEARAVLELAEQEKWEIIQSMFEIE